MALIAQYLLHLAANPAANELHNSSPESAYVLMIAFGLDKGQCDVVASGKPEEISKALAAEIPKPADPTKVITFQACSGIVKPNPMTGLKPEPPWWPPPVTGDRR